MGKTIINILTSPLSLINQDIGNVISGTVIAAIGIVTLQPELVAFGAGRIAGALAKTPKPEQTESAIKSPIPERVSGYGTGRHHMAYALYATASDGTAFDVGVFHDGQIAGIDGRYLGDKKVTVDGSGWVQAGEAGQFDGGKGWQIVRIGTTLGLPTETAFSTVVSALPDQWTADHRGDGCVTGFVRSGQVKSVDYQKVYPSGGPNQMPLSLVMRRQLCFDWRDPAQSPTDPTTWTYTENAILHLAHYELVRDNKSWDTHFAPTLAYWTAAADDCDIAVPLKGVQTILTAAVSHGTGTLPLSSVAGLSAGMTISISATGNTSLTETRTVSSISGLNVVVPSLSNDHPLGSQVTWSSGGTPATEPRYRSCVAHKHTDPHKGVVANLLACCDGWIAPRSDGALVVYSGRYYAPTVTIGPDQIIAYSMQDGIEEESAVNQLAVTYISANHDYNTVDTDAWEDDDDISARGKVLADQLANQVGTHSQARRLAKRFMAKSMAPKRGTCTTNAGGRIAIGQRYVTLRLIDAGTTFLDAPVEIMAPVKRNMQTGGITFNWVLADPNIDAWNPTTEEGEPAPVGNRIAALPLDPPVITSALANYGADSATGSPGVFLDLIITGPDRTDLTWYARTRQTGAATWGERQYTDVDPGSTVEIATEFVPIDTSIEVEVAYQTGDGRISDWSTLSTVSTSSAAIPPAKATGLAATGGVGTATIVWNNPTSANFAKSRLFHGTTTVFGSATQVGSDIVGVAGGTESHASTETAGVRYFWVTTVSTGGIAGSPVGPVSATVT